MRKTATRIHQQLQKLEFALMIAGGILAFLVMFIVVVDVFMRTVFNSPLTGVYELVIYLFIALVSFGFAYVQGQRGNIIVEVLTEKWPDPCKHLLDMIGCLAGFVFVAILTWKSGEQAYISFLNGEYQAQSLLQLPIWPAKAFVAVGMAVLSIRLLVDVFLYAAQLKPGKEGSS
jgi:TRAP-type C4-dicarboxylate transport system permease small subunit